MADKHPVQEISETECLELLATEQIGRIGVIVNGRPEIFPVNYALDITGAVVFETAPGTKLSGALINRVVFEVDRVIAVGVAWSVVVHGVAVQTAADSLRFAGPGPTPWVPDTFNSTRIHSESITGRRLVGGAPSAGTLRSPEPGGGRA